MVSDKLKSVILRTLGLDDFPLTDDTTAPEVPGWDSLNHIQILGEVEAAFGVRFRAHEAGNLPNVGALQRLVDRKLAEKAARAA